MLKENIILLIKKNLVGEVKKVSVLEKAQELCTAIKQSAEFKNFQQAKEALMNSPEDKDRLERYLLALKEVQQKEQEGHELTLEEKYHIQQLSKMVSFYPITTTYLGTQQAYLRLLKQIYGMIQAASQDKEIPNCSEKKSASGECTGSCQECGLG